MLESSSNKDFDNFPNENNNKNNILNLLEEANLERDNALRTLINFQNEHKSFNEEYNTIKNNYSSMEQNMNESKMKYNIMEKKLSENIDQLLEMERKLSRANNRNDMLSRENVLLREQLSYYENAFNDMKQRKQNEINELKNHIEELKDENEKINNEKNILQNELNEIKFKLKLLQQENEIAISDKEHMKQMLDENINKRKGWEEKINSVDNLINLYKKTNDELNIEIEKIKQEKIIEKEESNNAIKNFENTLREKDEMFEKIKEKIKNEYELKLNEQIDENENIRSKYVEYKIERDKYYGDLNILQDEYEKLKNDCAQQMLAMQNAAKEMDDDYQNKINILNDKIKFILNQNNELKIQNNELNMQLSNIFGKNNFDEKLIKNGEELYKELIKIKEENEQLKKALESSKN